MVTKLSRLVLPGLAFSVLSFAFLPFLPAADPAPNIRAQVSYPLPMGTRARQALNMNIPQVNIDGRPFSEVIDYLHQLSGANITVSWKVLEAVNVKPDTPITLQLSNVSFHKVLRLVLDQASPEATLVFPAEENVINITTEVEADKVLYTRVYTIEDLILGDVPQIVPPMINLSAISTDTTTMATSTGGGGGGGGGGSGGLFTSTGTNTPNQQDTPQKRGEDLVALVKEVVRPEVWSDNGGKSTIRYYAGKLIINAPASVLEQIGGPALP